MVWLNRDPFSLLRASTGLDGMLRAADGLAGGLSGGLSGGPRPSAPRTNGATAALAKAARTNLEVTEDSARLTSLIPGYGPDDLTVQVEGSAVHVAGHVASHGADETPAEARSFRRSFRLPFHVQPSDIVASVDDGVLVVDLPRRVEDRPTWVPIAGATRAQAASDVHPTEADAADDGQPVEAAVGAGTPQDAGTDGMAVEADPLPRFRPRAHASRTASGLQLTIEIPGARRESLKLGVEDGELTLQAHSAFAPVPQGLRASFYEFRVGAGYDGRWALPDDVDPDRATSSYAAGELTVNVPLRAQSRRTIEVS